jgi:hypothetical protein
VKNLANDIDDNIEIELVDVELIDKELRVDTYRASGSASSWRRRSPCGSANADKQAD